MQVSHMLSVTQHLCHLKIFELFHNFKGFIHCMNVVNLPCILALRHQ
jgi:hypothetical protein